MTSDSGSQNLPAGGQLRVEVHLEPGSRLAAIERDVSQGLLGHPKQLPPIWFYDERGSQLFDEITRLPEYYPTRAERSILEAHAKDIVRTSEADTLIELGSGTSEKTRLLLDAMAAAGQLNRFVPFDVSEEILRAAAGSVADEYGIDVVAVVGDFSRHLDRIPTGGRRLVAFLGSTIGNLGPTQRGQFLADLRGTMGPDDRLLLGTDLVKPVDRLLAAYDDAQGITAAFNRNVLSVINNELDASFDLDAFDHVVRWDPVNQRIEMRLGSRLAQVVPIRGLQIEVAFDAGEELLTEISSKFSPEQVGTELLKAGFASEATWTDGGGDFMLSLARPAL